jgi:hypothetical protein
MKTLCSFRKNTVALMIWTIVQVNLTQAQTAINETGTVSANTTAALDISSTTKGVLFPVMTDVQRQALPAPAAGLLIYNRTGGNYNYFNGTSWYQILSVYLVTATNPGGAADSAGVGVGVAAPDPSAILEINSYTKGFLLPNVTASPASPATGLIYYSTSANQIELYNGASWNQVNGTVLATVAGGASTAAGLLVGPGLAASATVAPSAKMEVRSSTTGLLIPRMTAAQRNAIPSPAEGLCLYSTTENAVEFYAAGAWFEWSAGANTYGLIVGNPGKSCLDILNNNPSTAGTNGSGYYISPNGTSYQCYCDMTGNNGDGGGWTLVENTGPAATNNGNSTAAGTYTPVSISTAGGAYGKISDADINQIRIQDGGYATVPFRLYRANNSLLTATQKYFYVQQNKIWVANGSVAQCLNAYSTTYLGVINTTGANYQTGIDTWQGGGAAGGYEIIFNYSNEGFISNGCTGCGGPSGRSEINGLLWVK